MRDVDAPARRAVAQECVPSCPLDPDGARGPIGSASLEDGQTVYEACGQ